METERIVELILQEIQQAQKSGETGVSGGQVTLVNGGQSAPVTPVPAAVSSISADSACQSDAPEGLELDARPCKDFILPGKLGASGESRTQTLQRMKAATSARIGIGKCGARMRTNTILQFRADHAAAKDAVAKDVPEELLQSMGLFAVQTLCTDHDQYLTRPDLGRRFSAEALETIAKNCTPNVDVQIYAAGGLSSTAITANLANILPAMTDGLKAKHLTVGVPFYVRFARVASMDEISELLHAKVVCVLIGERPGLATAESMSAYIAYQATVGMPESRRTVVSNIHRGGISASEAGAYIADLIEKIIQKQASGVDFNK